MPDPYRTQWTKSMPIRMYVIKYGGCLSFCFMKNRIVNTAIRNMLINTTKAPVKATILLLSVTIDVLTREDVTRTSQYVIQTGKDSGAATAS